MSKLAIITGGSRGLGAAMVEKLGDMGFNVVLNYVSPSSEKLCDELIEKLREKGVDGLAVQGNVGEFEDCKKIVEAAVEKFGKKIDVLINNAGVTNNASFHEMDPADYTRLMNINLMSALHMCRNVLPYMVEASEGGLIINMSSVGGLMGVAKQGDYCASKAGLIGLTRGLAMEYGPQKIRVNAICPGMIWTDMLRGVNQDEVQALKNYIPIGEIGEVEAISSAMEFLINNDYMTGQFVSPNGGLVMP